MPFLQMESTDSGPKIGKRSGEIAGSNLEAFLPASGSQMRMQEAAVGVLTFISRLTNRTIFPSVLKESEDATQTLQ